MRKKNNPTTECTGSVKPFHQMVKSERFKLVYKKKPMKFKIHKEFYFKGLFGVIFYNSKGEITCTLEIRAYQSMI